MENAVPGKYTASFGVSFAATSLLSALLVVLKETSKDTVLAWMKAATGHHWITHGVIVLAVFLVLGFVLAATRGGDGVRVGANGLIAAVVGSTVLSGLIVGGFFLGGA